MTDKFIIEITDNHSNKCYFNGLYFTQIQVAYGIENAMKLNLHQSVINYDKCKLLIKELSLNFEIKEI